MDEYNLISKYENLIYKISKKFYNVELEDLYQAGCIGLIKAYRKYNQNTNTSFINYAYKYIFGEMYELANKSRDIKLNKAYLKLYKQIEMARTYLINITGKIPSNQELCDYLEINETTLSEVITLTTKMLSIDDEYATLNGDTISISEIIGTSKDYDEQIMLNDSLKKLDPLEQKIIKIRYFEDLTQDETAQVLGLSQVKVSRIESKGKAKIKKYIAA